MAWHDNGTTPAKDKRMAMTEENFARVIAMRDELIEEQKELISRLKRDLNNTYAKLFSTKIQLERCDTISTGGKGNQ